MIPAGVIAGHGKSIVRGGGGGYTPLTFPTQTSVGISGVGLTESTLTHANDGPGSGLAANKWEPGDFYGSSDGAIWEQFSIVTLYPFAFPASDAGKTITFRKCNIYGGPENDAYTPRVITNPNGVNLVFEDCTIVGGTAEAVAEDSGLTFRRCYVHGSGDGAKFTSGTEWDSCYVDAWIDPASVDPHADGLQTQGVIGDGSAGSGAWIHGCTIWMPNNSTSCIILSTGSATDMRDILIEDNLFSGGVYCVYGGYDSATDDVNKVSNIIIRNNAISTSVYPNGGSSGPLTSVDAPVSHTGNYWYDGANAGVLID